MSSTMSSMKRPMQDDVESSGSKRTRVEEGGVSAPVYVYYWSNFDETFERKYMGADGEPRSCTERNLVVVAYGLTENGQTVCVRFTDVYRRLLIEFPDSVDLAERYRAAAVEGINRCIFKFSDKKYTTVRRFKPLYSVGDTKPMLEVSVSSNIAAMTIAKRAREGMMHDMFPFVSRTDKILVHELDATPELQLTTTRNLPSVGWIQCGARAVLVPESNKISRCDLEIVCHALNVASPDQPPCSVPTFTLASWDCEAFIEDISSPGSGARDTLFQASIVTNTGIKKLLTMGDPLVDLDDPEWRGVELQTFKTERDLLVGIGQAFKEIRPHIVTGWNVHGFDWELLAKRASHYLCLDQSLDFSWNVNRPTEMRTKNMLTAAAGHRKLTFPKADGVLAIDMLQIIKDNMKLSKYSLEFVGQALLGEGKDDVDLAELIRCFKGLGSAAEEDRRCLAKVSKYCVQDSALVVKIAEKQQAVLSLMEFSSVVNTPPDLVHTCGQQLRFYNTTYRSCRPKGIAVQSDQGGQYSGQGYTGAYVCDPEPGLYNFVVSFDFASMYPSIIQCYNVDFSTVVECDSHRDMPEEDFRRVEWEDHLGCDHDPLIAECAELSESIAAARDEDARFVLGRRLTALSKRLASRRSKRICAPRKFKIYQKERGVLPNIVENLLTARRETRAQMKTIPKGSDLQTLLNQRQLAYKVAANSMYGAMGVDEGRLKCKHAAMCVTALGRESIHMAARILKEHGTQQIYGDTDSVYGRFPDLDGIVDKKERAHAVWEKACSTAAETTAMFKKPMAIEFEDKIYENFLILSKKRYIYNTISPDGKSDTKLGNRGVLLTRRDYSKFTKDSYDALIRLVFAGGSLEDARQFMTERFLMLFTRQVPVEDVCISKSVNPLVGGDEPVQGITRARGSSSKGYSLYGYSIRDASPPANLSRESRRAFFVSQLPPQMQLALRMQARGFPIPDGNRLEYCVVQRPFSKNKSVAAQIEDLRYIKKHGERVRVCYESAMNATRVSHTEVAEVVWKRQDPLACVYDQFSRKVRVMEDLKQLFAPRFVLTS